MATPLSHVIGFDDAPFERSHRGDVIVVGALFAGSRLDRVLTGKVRRDGANAARTLIEMVRHSKQRVQLVLLQGIALAGLNVVDVFALHDELHLPIVVVARRRPDLAMMKSALLRHVRGGARKWSIIERLGPMQSVEGVLVQRLGIEAEAVGDLLRRLAIHSRVPEPIRVAHLIAGAIATGQSGGRV